MIWPAALARAGSVAVLEESEVMGTLQGPPLIKMIMSGGGMLTASGAQAHKSPPSVPLPPTSLITHLFGPSLADVRCHLCRLGGSAGEERDRGYPAGPSGAGGGRPAARRRQLCVQAQPGLPLPGAATLPHTGQGLPLNGVTAACAASARTPAFGPCCMQAIEQNCMALCAAHHIKG